MPRSSCFRRLWLSLRRVFTGGAEHWHACWCAEVVTGGEMFTHLRKARKFSDEVSKFYGLQVRGG
jgi:hypothetical protein